MQALFLVFLAAAWLNELVVAVALARDTGVRHASLTLGLATGVALFLTALLAAPDWLGPSFDAVPERLGDFLFASCFMCVLMQLASGRAHPAALRAGAQQWRVALPLLSGNLAVMACSITQGLPKPVATLAASLGLTVALALLAPIAMAVLDRLQVSMVPAAMRGTPIIVLSAALAALGMTGLGPALPW